MSTYCNSSHPSSIFSVSRFLFSQCDNVFVLMSNCKLSNLEWNKNHSKISNSVQTNGWRSIPSNDHPLTYKKYLLMYSLLTFPSEIFVNFEEVHPYVSPSTSSFDLVSCALFSIRLKLILLPRKKRKVFTKSIVYLSCLAFALHERPYVKRKKKA